MRSAFLLAFAGVYGCVSTQAEPNTERIRTVRVAAVEAEAPVRTVTLDGVTRAAQRARVAPEVPGRIARRVVRIGDRVKRGDLIAVLDAKGPSNRRDAVRAQLSEVDERLEQLQRDLARTQRLADEGTVGSTQLERLATESRAATSQREALQNQLDEAERQWAETRIRSPFDGTITALTAEPGEVVGAGTPVAFVTGDGIEVQVELPETLWAALDERAQVRVHLPALDEVLDGTLVDIAAASEARTGLFPVTVAIPAGGKRTSGLTAIVTLALPTEAALLTPVRSIVDPTGTAPSVFVVREGHASRVPVQVDGLFGTRVAIRGLEAGDSVVVAGHARLLDGERIEVVR